MCIVADDMLVPIEEFPEHEIISGIIIAHVCGGQLHCGIAYKSEGQANALHLAWHYDLRDQPAQSLYSHGYYFTLPSIDIIRQRVIAAKCRRISRAKEQEIPYGLLYEGATFDNDGILRLGGNEHGLTCATFVMAVYASCGITLCDYAAWPARQEDGTWHDFIIDLLRQHRAPQEHLHNLGQEIGCARFRPEEVAASITFPDLPAPVDKIWEKGVLIRQRLIH